MSFCTYKRGRFGVNQEVLVLSDEENPKLLVAQVRSTKLIDPIFGDPCGTQISIDPNGIIKNKIKDDKYHMYLIKPGNKKYERFVFKNLNEKEMFMYLIEGAIYAIRNDVC